MADVDYHIQNSFLTFHRSHRVNLIKGILLQDYEVDQFGFPENHVVFHRYTVITQNIDGLHQMAGSRRVLELHGSVHRNYCQKCGKGFDAEYILKSGTEIPLCDACGGKIKPDVVLYEEGLNQQTLEDAVFYISHADVLIIGGTSLAVYPAAGLIDYYRGNKLVLINKSTTPMDGRADLLIQAGLGEVFSQIR